MQRVDTVCDDVHKPSPAPVIVASFLAKFVGELSVVLLRTLLKSSSGLAQESKMTLFVPFLSFEVGQSFRRS